MSNIQSKINSELRRPNAGKDALCNVVADVAQAIADNGGGGGTSIPTLKVLRIDEVTIDGDTAKVVIFDDASNKVLDDMVNYEVQPGYTNILSTLPCKIGSNDIKNIYNHHHISGGESIPDDVLLANDWYGIEMTQHVLTDDAEVLGQFLVFFLGEPIMMIRYISGLPEESINRWVLN